MNKILHILVGLAIVLSTVLILQDTQIFNTSVEGTNIYSAQLYLPQGYDPALTRSSNINEFLVSLVNWVLTFLAIISIIMIIYGGFLMVTSGGDEAMHTKGVSIVKWTVIGIVVILASYAIVSSVLQFAVPEDQGPPKDATSSELIHAFLQADPTTAVLADNEEEKIVNFTMIGSEDTTGQLIPTGVETKVYIWFGDETDNTTSGHPLYHPTFGLNITCGADVNAYYVSVNETPLCITPTVNGGITTISASESISHAYTKAGTFTAKFYMVAYAAGQAVQSAFSSQTIQISHANVDYSVPAPVAGFVYNVTSIKNNLQIEFTPTARDKGGNNVTVDETWLTSPDHKEYSGHRFVWDFNMNVDSDGDGNKLNDDDLRKPQEASSNCPDATTPCWKYSAYTIEDITDYTVTTTTVPTYRVTYTGIPEYTLRVKLKLTDTTSLRDDEVVRNIMIPDDLTDYRQPPTALFSYVINEVDVNNPVISFSVFNQSFGIDNEPLKVNANNFSGNNLIVGDIEYLFLWDIDAKSESHPISIVDQTYSATSCTAATTATAVQANLTATNDGVPDNDIDTLDAKLKYSGLGVEGSNISCPVMFAIEDYKTYNLQLTVVARDSVAQEEFSRDSRIIEFTLIEPFTLAPQAAFVVAGINPATKTIQFKNTSKYFDIANINTQPYADIDQLPYIINPSGWNDIYGTTDPDILTLWDFDIEFDSDGNGNKTDDEDADSSCTSTGIDPIDCTAASLVTTSSNVALHSPAKTFINHDNNPSFDIEEGKTKYTVKLTLSQRNPLNNTWLTDSVTHTITIPEGPSPLTKFTYSQDLMNDKLIYFLNTTTDSEGNTLPDGTEIIWDFDTLIDTDNDGAGNNDADESCTITALTCMSTSNIDIIQTVSHAFTSYKAYKVQLTVTYPSGESNSFEQFVYVTELQTATPPVSAFTFSIDAQNDHNVNFNIQSIANNAGTLSYDWDFDTSYDTDGDGTKDNDSDNPANNTQTTDQFNVIAITAPTAETNYSPGINSAKVKLTTLETLNSGQILTDTVERTINFPTSTKQAPPQSNFKVERNGSIVEFLNFSTDGSGNALSVNSAGYTFEWDFDLTKEPSPNPFPNNPANTDGNTSNDVDSDIFKPTAYDYQLFDTYTIKLTVTNPSGLTDTKTVTVTLDESQTNTNIIAKIDANPIQGFAPLSVDFSSAGSQDKNGTITNILWDFGDTTPPIQDQTNVTHIYEQAGHFRAGLAVQGPSGTATKYIFIEVLSSNPEVQILAGLENAGAPQVTYQATLNEPINFKPIVQDPTGTGTNFTYNWEFLDQGYTTASTSSASHTFTELGTNFTVKLTVTNTTTNLSTTVSRTIKVISAPPQAKIVATSDPTFANISSPSNDNYFADIINPTTGTFTVYFSSQDSLGAPLPNNQNSVLKTFTWNFGDASPERLSSNLSEQIPHIYKKSGTFHVLLTVEDEDGLKHTKEKIVFIADANQPIPKINITPITGTTQTTITFDGTKSFSNNGAIHSYDWVIGYAPFNITNPGTQFHTSKEKRKLSVPSNANGYDIQLTVTDTTGAQSTILIPGALHIIPQPPQAGFSLSKVDNIPNEFFFDASDTTYDKGLDPSDISYTWSFGDATTDNGITISHIFPEVKTYQVTLTVDDGNTQNTITKSVKVTSILVAKIINIDPIVGKIGDTGGLEVFFSGEGGNNSSSGIDSSSIIGTDWDFGDNQIITAATSETVKYVFKRAGHLLVKFTVYDNNNNTASVTATIHVGSPDPKPLGVIDGELLNYELLRVHNLKNQEIKFSGIKSLNSFGEEDINGSLLNYSWDFGDASPINSDPQPIHIYTKPGEYIVQMTVTDISNSKSDIDRVKFTIKTSKPIASFVVDPLEGKSPLLAEFDGSDSFDKDGTIVQYRWNFGDGSTGITTTAITNHPYTNTTNRRKTFTVTLEVVDDDSEVEQTRRTVNVDPS